MAVAQASATTPNFGSGTIKNKIMRATILKAAK